LVAADNTGRFSPGTFQGDRETGRPREVSGAGDRENDRDFRYAVERVRRDDQDRPPSLLLVSLRGVKSYQFVWAAQFRQPIPS
jgi:hypothetical protein